MSEFLVRYNAARKALAEAVRVDEVKEALSEAEAIRGYAQVAKDRGLIENATELRRRAERRLGEMMAAQPKATGGEHGGKRRLDGFRENPSNPKATLAEAGIDKNLADRARKAAALPEEEFEMRVQEAKSAAARSVEKPMKVVGSKDKPKSSKRRIEVSDAKREAIARAHLDDRKPKEQVASEFDISVQIVKTSVERELGRREPPIELKTLPPDDQKRVATALDAEKRRLQASFEQAVLDEVKRRIDKTVLPHYNKQAFEHRQIIEARKGVMTRKDYLLIASCLHPDQSASKERLADAFIAFTKHELALCAEKEMPTSGAPIPRTYDEMMKRRGGMKAKRRKQSNVVQQRSL